MAASDPRKRIIAHMNKEHSADLERYLRVFNGVSASSAAGARLTDLTHDALTITSASGTHTVAVSPAPMKSFAEARERLVDMAERARAALGLEAEDHDDGKGADMVVVVDRFVGARGAGIVSFVGVAFYLVSATALATGVLRPGTAAWALLDAWFPYDGAAGFARLARLIAVPTAAIHLAEAWWMDRSRLATHGVRAGSALWLKWVLQTFIEGYPAFLRFDGIVEEEKEKKKKRA